MSLFSYLVVIFCFLTFQYTSSIPNITPCKKGDNVCFVSLVNDLYHAVVRGDPGLDIRTSDPLDQELVEASLATIKYTLTNSSCVGFDQCNILKAEFSRRNNKLNLEMQCPKLRMTGNYEINGNLLIMPIQGKGPYWIECRDYLVKFDADTDLTQSNDSKSYMTIKSFSFTTELRGGMDFDLINLFNGRRELADRVLQFARQNWKPVANLLQGPVFNANLRTIVKNVNEFMKHVPLENIVHK